MEEIKCKGLPVISNEIILVDPKYLELKCNGKTIYSSAKLANIAKNSIKRKSNRSKIPKRAYYCVECLGWHLTSHKTKHRKDE